jgi:putative ubiquitin-RnfH superfamily antitoxin RatB of RatAB toxin-antitoxin module
MRGSLRVEVVLALAGRQDRVRLELAEGATVSDALAASGLAGQGAAVGIGGKVVPASRRLRDGERVELLRPLAQDPREARRQRARRRRTRV